MQVHPDIARLRRNLAPQPRTDAALAAWRAVPEVAAAMAALARFDAGKALSDCPALACILTDHAAALRLVEHLVTPLIAALRAEPLAQLPLGHSAAPGVARLRLASHGRTGLTLMVFAPRTFAAPAAALFEDAAVHELVLAGAGQALAHRLRSGERDEPPITSTEIVCAPGTRMMRSGPQDARQIIAVTQPLLLLQLTREPSAPRPSREIALADGRQMAIISGCKRTSQQLMALGVLGALGHRSAATAMGRLAQDRAAQRDLRWEALRQLLALDAPRGLAVLSALVRDPCDVLRGPAAALQRQFAAKRSDLAALLPQPA